MAGLKQYLLAATAGQLITLGELEKQGGSMNLRHIKLISLCLALLPSAAFAQQYKDLGNGNEVRCGGYAPDGHYVFCDGDGSDKSLRDRLEQIYKDAKEQAEHLQKSFSNSLGDLDTSNRRDGEH